MNNFWMKLKVWSKAILFGLVGLYVIIFLAMNWEAHVDREINFVFTKSDPKPRILTVLLLTAIVSIIGWWLFRMVFRTYRQFREMRDRNRTTKLEKEVAEMKAKTPPAKDMAPDPE